MQLSGEKLIEAPRPKVWEALTDPAFLSACRQDDAATPASTTLDTTVRLSDLDPPSGCTVCFAGQGVSEPVRVRLYDTDAQTTRLTYEGAGAGAAQENFFARFAAAVSHGAAIPGGPATAEAQLRADGKPPGSVAPGLEAVPPGAPQPPDDPKAHVAHAEPYHPPAHEDHDHDPSNPHYFGLPLGVILAGTVAGISVCITIIKFLL